MALPYYGSAILWLCHIMALPYYGSAILWQSHKSIPYKTNPSATPIKREYGGTFRYPPCNLFKPLYALHRRLGGPYMLCIEDWFMAEP
jgi:hypothetical protein